MIKNRWFCLVVAAGFSLISIQAQTPPGPAPGTAAPAGAGDASAASLSAPAADVVRLAEAGTSEEVILAHIQSSPAPFGLSVDQILYLRDVGLSSPVIQGMLSRDKALQAQPQTYNYNQTAYPPTQPPVAPVAAPDSVPQVAPPLPSQAPAPVYVGSPPPEVNYFYDDLSPYGSWIQLDGVGWCWQPRVVVINHGWQPYCDAGHWVNTDAGWCWVSEYSWGWAPFHYGRWQRHERCGWVWLPDRVWGPAWVVWRSEGENCGWAPLPPHADFDARLGWRFNGVKVSVNFDFGLRPDHFTFIALHDFNEHDYGHRRLPPAEVTRVYNHTTVINNYVVNNNTIVNQGIKVDRVAAATHTEVRKVAIRDVPAPGGRTMRTPGTDRSGLVVYRQQLRAPTQPTHMVAQKVDDRHPVVQHAPIVASRPLHTAGTANPALPSAPSGRAQLAPARTPAPLTPSKPDSRPQQHYAAPGSPAAATATALPSEKRTYEQPHPRMVPGHAPQGNTANRTAANPPQTVYSGSQGQPKPAPYGQASHVYYPKGYYQSAETHSLPPVNSPPSNPNSSSGKDQRGQPR